jgi:hypothetical protein
MSTPVLCYSKLIGPDQRVYYLTKLKATLGRCPYIVNFNNSPDNNAHKLPDVHISDLTVISRIHFTLEWVKSSWYISCNSPNGLVVDNKFLTAHHAPLPILSQSLIQLSHDQFYYFLLPSNVNFTVNSSAELTAPSALVPNQLIIHYKPRKPSSKQSNKASEGRNLNFNASTINDHVDPNLIFVNDTSVLPPNLVLQFKPRPFLAPITHTLTENPKQRSVKQELHSAVYSVDPAESVAVPLESLLATNPINFDEFIAANPDLSQQWKSKERDKFKHLLLTWGYSRMDQTLLELRQAGYTKSLRQIELIALHLIKHLQALLKDSEVELHNDLMLIEPHYNNLRVDSFISEWKLVSNQSVMWAGRLQQLFWLHKAVQNNGLDNILANINKTMIPGKTPAEWLASSHKFSY